MRKMVFILALSSIAQAGPQEISSSTWHDISNQIDAISQTASKLHGLTSAADTLASNNWMIPTQLSQVPLPVPISQQQDAYAKYLILKLQLKVATDALP